MEKLYLIETEANWHTSAVDKSGKCPYVPELDPTRSDVKDQDCIIISMI